MFTPDVIEQLKYYVYRLLDPRTGQTFYVGKGKGNRVFAHVNDALKDYGGQEYIETDEDEVSAKIQQIRDIHNAGLEVIHVIQRFGLSEKEAFEVEAALIDCFPGLTNMQSGYSSDRGVNNAEVLQRDLSYEIFEDIENLSYCVIKISDASINEQGSIYEAVRKAWKVNLKRINEIPYVLAANNGVIREVYEVTKWYPVEGMPERAMFDGKVASLEIRELFVNKRLPLCYMKKGMAAPVLYHDKW